jgi:peptidoglycan/LPS O-acetylase OafA/YrhL
MPMPTDHVASLVPGAAGRESANRPRLALLDILRLIAALSVLFFHWLFWAPTHGVTVFHSTPVTWLAAYGFLGVQLFFIISGFVIFLSASGRTAFAFATGRATRLYPAFWAGVLLTTATILLTTSTTPAELLPRFLANLTMAPDFLGEARVDSVYWTLTQELKFYGLVFLFLLFRRRHWLDTFFPLWAIGMLATTLFLPRIAELPLAGDLFSLFAGGAIIAMIARSGWTVLRAVGLIASIIAGVVATIREVALGSDPDSVDPVVLAVVVVLLFALVYVLTRPKVAAVPVPGTRLLGALTYPLYLTHAIFGYALLELWVDADSIWPGTMLALAVVLAVSAAIHFVVERAGARLWRSLFSVVFWPVAKVEEWLPGRGPSATRAGTAVRAPAEPPSSPTS